MTTLSLGALVTGTAGFAPCTAEACRELLRAHGIEPLLEGDSNKYGGDADTQPAINTYETTDSSFGR